MTPGQYRLSAEGRTGIQFKNETLINLHAKNITVLVQTDKAIYKPGDHIRFRVIILDSNMRPSKIEGPVRVYITVNMPIFICVAECAVRICINLFKDGNNNRIKQWTDALISRGVFEGDLQLSDQVVYGDWSINTDVNGNVRQTLWLHVMFF